MITLINKKTLPLLLATLWSFNILIAQQSESDFWKHVRFGGGIGLSFGNGFFSGTLAPSALYEFNNNFAMGVGLNGTYNRSKDFYKSTIFGGSLIGLYSPVNSIQMSAEFEELYVSRKYDNNIFRDDSYWYPALFLGAGYRNRNVTFGIRYDVLYDRNKSIYADPWAPFVRVYF
ncbi:MULTISPECIES: alpha-ketoglutarate decarboxylase [Aestuariibaculum]|uniref:Alpha-ketoglutarate decarboxylase n=1 Tax=Aestuariibaculum lutulentum TaxID=2920935 RepID=A0ABS9RLY7_9FLAO|nr:MULTISPECIES: alpha-ketoglutarate decarboxylase [Aestuariibaculum]MCH4553960.1 alpha-ketoglutarate decarboxylase [Aestuariibaculum lutulentum]MCR8669457.1 alpha-ketoglutarate decarboxylase [Aestuariibaculum sp. M13]